MKRNYLAFLFFGLISCTVQAQNVGGIWLSGSGVVGEGTSIHSGEIQVLSIEDSIINTISAGVGAGKLVFGSFRFKKSLDANSVPFLSSLRSGTILPSFVFKFYERKLIGSFAPSFTITLSNVIIIKYKISSESNGNAPQTSEEINLLYDKIQFTDNAGNSTVVQAALH